MNSLPPSLWIRCQANFRASKIYLCKNNYSRKWACDLETKYAINSLLKWIMQEIECDFYSRLCWSTFAFSYIFQHRWHLEMPCIRSHIWLISRSPSAPVLRHAVYFTPNISRFFWLSYGQMMTVLGVREGISETSINRLSKGSLICVWAEIKWQTVAHAASAGSARDTQPTCPALHTLPGWREALHWPIGGRRCTLARRWICKYRICGMRISCTNTNMYTCV